MPTGFYLCQSIFYGSRDNHDAPPRHRHSLPSEGCITGSQSLECYVIGKAQWAVYSCSLCAHSRGWYHYKVLLSSNPLLPSAFSRAQLIAGWAPAMTSGGVCTLPCRHLREYTVITGYLQAAMNPWHRYSLRRWQTEFMQVTGDVTERERERDRRGGKRKGSSGGKWATPSRTCVSVCVCVCVCVCG